MILKGYAEQWCRSSGTGGWSFVLIAGTVRKSLFWMKLSQVLLTKFIQSKSCKYKTLRLEDKSLNLKSHFFTCCLLPNTVCLWCVIPLDGPAGYHHVNRERKASLPYTPMVLQLLFILKVYRSGINAIRHSQYYHRLQ